MPYTAGKEGNPRLVDKPIEELSVHHYTEVGDKNSFLYLRSENPESDYLLRDELGIDVIELEEEDEPQDIITEADTQELIDSLGVILVDYQLISDTVGDIPLIDENRDIIESIENELNNQQTKLLDDIDLLKTDTDFEKFIINMREYERIMLYILDVADGVRHETNNIYILSELILKQNRFIELLGN